MTDKKALSKLKQKLRALVNTSDEARYRGSFDGMKISFMPDAVLMITEAEQVGVVLKLANEHKVPVTTRGAGSSLTGSASPMKGGWVLNMTRLNKIKIDKLSGIAEVQAGSVIAKIQQAAEKVQWFYPPDPSSNKFATIGGTIACNAGGLRGAKYGVTRDYVMALTGYFANGEPFSFSRPLRKWAVGYNLRDLMIGSEGTLGVVTGASLRLIALPESRATFLAAFATEESAFKGIRAILEERLAPVALEFLDSTCIKGLEDATGRPVFKGHAGASVVLIEIDGTAAELNKQRSAIRAWGKVYANAFREARDLEQAEALWDVRRGSSPAMFAFGDSKLNEDVIVPLRKQIPLIRLIRRLRRESGLHIPMFGHAADGNFHVNIMYYRDDKKQCKQAEKAVRTLMKEVVAMGGAISGEHGIGLAKTEFLREQLADPEVEAMLSVKQALDPNNILNPGKIFEPYATWKHAPEKVALPWDHKKLETDGQRG